MDLGADWYAGGGEDSSVRESQRQRAGRLFKIITGAVSL